MYKFGGGFCMKINKIFMYILSFAILSSLILPGKSYAEWAYSFVVYDGYIYVISDEYVADIDKEIGKVTKYSDKEGTYYGDFSNTYKKGTKYYSIKGVSTDLAIAIEDNGKYIKAIRSGEYAGDKYNPFSFIIGGIIVFIILTLVIYTVMKRVRSIKST